MRRLGFGLGLVVKFIGCFFFFGDGLVLLPPYTYCMSFIFADAIFFFFSLVCKTMKNNVNDDILFNIILFLEFERFSAGFTSGICFCQSRGMWIVAQCVYVSAWIHRYDDSKNWISDRFFFIVFFYSFFTVSVL